MATKRRRRDPREPGAVLVDASWYLLQEADPARRVEVRAAAAELVGAAAAEARAAGAQVRAIHRLWLAAQGARTAGRHEALAEARAQAAAGTVVPWSPVGEPEHQLVLDVAAEVGAALHLPSGTACRRVEDAVILAEDLPDVLAALEAGTIGWTHATVMIEQWRRLVLEADDRFGPGGAPVPPPVDAVLRLITELLERAPGTTAAQLRAAARNRWTALMAGAAERARRAARKHRCVWVEPAPDGMAYLHALLEAPVAVAVHGRLEELVGHLGEGVPVPGGAEPILLPHPELPEEAEDRSPGELRADVLADLLLDGELPGAAGFPRGIRAQVSVLVPVGLLAAEDPEVPGGTPGRDLATAPAAGAAGRSVAGCAAAVLSGYGPISAQVARQLAAGAGAWHRILTHPVTGVVLDHDRTVYTVPADLRRLVQVRDGTCRFPGCRRRAAACELDHTVAWADGGTTAEGNLAALCRSHHRIKHRHGALGSWTVRRVRAEGRAVLEWISPGGLVHRTIPEHQHPTPVPEPEGLPVEDPPGEPPPAWLPGGPRPYDLEHDPAPF